MQMQTDATAYFAVAGTAHTVRPAEASKLFAAYQAAKKAFQQSEATFAGAFFSLVFMERPYLAGMKLKLNCDSESDDSGGMFRTVSVRVSDITYVEGVQIPEDLMSNGEGDSDAIGDEIKQEVDECSDDMYSCFETDRGCYDDLEFTIERSSIADLLKQDRINGREAYVKLFPDFIREVQEVA